MLKIKTGVTPPNLVIAAALANVSEILRLDLVITSGTDGTHMVGSKHYLGAALDIRISNLSEAELKAVQEMLRRRLGTSYQVILEADHLHCEFDPKS